jgi:hypothetical protein
MGCLDAVCRWRQVDEDLTVLHFHFVARYGRRNVRSCRAGQAMELPTVPRTNGIPMLAKSTVSQRAADMVALAGDRAKLAVAIGEGKGKIADLDLLKRFIRILSDGAKTMPPRFVHISLLRYAAFLTKCVVLQPDFHRHGNFSLGPDSIAQSPVRTKQLECRLDPFPRPPRPACHGRKSHRSSP